MPQKLGGIQKALGGKRHIDLLLAAVQRQREAGFAATAVALQGQAALHLALGGGKAVAERLLAAVAVDLAHSQVELERLGRLDDKAQPLLSPLETEKAQRHPPFRRATFAALLERGDLHPGLLGKQCDLRYAHLLPSLQRSDGIVS